MNRYHIAEYESGWFVEEPDPKFHLEDCKFVSITGPYKTKQGAQRACDRFNKIAVGETLRLGKRIGSA